VTSLPVRKRTAISLRVTCFAAVFATCGSATWVFGQGHNQPLPGGPRGVMAPPAGGFNPGGFNPAGPGGQVQDRWVPGKAIPGGKGPAPEININPDKLPDGFKPPGSRDEMMDIDRPLVAADEFEKLKKEFSKLGTVLRTARSTDADKTIIKNGIRYRLALLCLLKNRPELSKHRDDLMRDLTAAASAPENPKPAEVKAFRQFVMQEVVNQAAPLLQTQNFYVRLHVAILLGELNLTEENTRLGSKVESFTPACEPLVQSIMDPKQPAAVKVAAVNSIVRLLKNGTASFQVRTKIAEAFVAELKNKDSHTWYQMRLAGALAAVDIDGLDASRKPYVVDVLKDVMLDDTRDWTVRAEAAKSLGRVPLPPVVNPPTVTRAVAEFALKLSKAAQSKPDDPKWKGGFIKVYLAFQQLDANDMMANKTTKAGLLNNAAAAAKTAYDLIVPLVAAVLHGQRLTPQQVQTLETWVSPTPPGNAPAQSSNQPKNAAPAEPKGSEETSPMTLGADGRK